MAPAPRPFAQLRLQLQSGLEPLPADTRYRVRLASVLGGKYLELLPGQSRGAGVPDGGTLTLSNPRSPSSISTLHSGSSARRSQRHCAFRSPVLRRDRRTRRPSSTRAAPVGRSAAPLQNVLALWPIPPNRLCPADQRGRADDQRLGLGRSDDDRTAHDAATTFGHSTSRPWDHLDQLPPRSRWPPRC